MTEIDSQKQEQNCSAELSVNGEMFQGHLLAQIRHDIAKYAPSKIVGVIANLMLIPLYTSLLKPSEYGLYMIATSTLSFLCILFSDWVGLAALRMFRENVLADSIKSYFGTLFILLSVNVGVMFASGFLTFDKICNFFKIPSDVLLMVFLLIIPVAIRCLLSQVLRAQIKPLSYTFSTIFNQFLTIGISLYFIKFWHMGAKALLFGMAGSIIVTDIIMFFQCDSIKSTDIKVAKVSILSSFYKYGVPIAMADLGLWIINQSNRFVLQHFKGASLNGILGVGYNLTFSMIMQISAIITMAAIPRLFHIYEAGADTKKLLTKLTSYYLVVFAPVIFILFVYPEQMVALFSNKSYAEAHLIIPFLALSVFFYGLTEYTTIQYHLAKKTYITTFIRVIPGILGLLLSVYLIPRIGLIGIGVSTLISYAFYFILSILINVKNLAWVPPYKDVLKIAAALAGCWACVCVLPVAQSTLQFVEQSILLFLLYALIFKLQRY